MALSSDLISKFVKATKDEPTAQKETVVYGVVTRINPIHVRLVESDSNSDNSTVYSEEIPVTTTTTVVEVNDKVECTIKNHKLSITGTSDYPAARRDSTINKEDLVASKIKVDTLDAANVTVQQMLDAHQATIDELDATYVRVDELEADFVSVEELEANYIKADEIKSTYATISALEAVDAKIDNLDVIQGNIDNLTSDVAKIDELIFGSATGDVIQTSFSNAVIAQLGDAQIKSAMIESVSASKITAGDIITNNVRVMSEDGSLIISDETLQISDDNRVRVQIGKDASNDYSINVWDQNGNLMFSKGGITDAAIKEAIIRNDMVSDTANIHASKLDIDSLFEEINDSSNTIKSTKIYLDEEKQTLDVAFKSLTTEVTEQGETISSQGTAISAIQGQISSKIWQQDINTAKNEMSTQYSTLEQDVNGFKTTVSETYSTKSDLSSLTIGGRNLVTKTSDEWRDITVTAWSGQLWHTVNGINNYTHQYTDYGVKIGDKLTFSVDISAVGKKCNIRVDYRAEDGSAKANGGNYILPGETGRSTVTLKILDGYVGFNVYIGSDGTVSDGIISKYKCLKIEKGDKSTDWTPAPEDVDAEITNLDARILSAESSITQLTNSITANVTETTNLGTRMTTIEQTAEDLSVELDTLEIGGRNILLKSDFSNKTNTDNFTYNSSERMVTVTSDTFAQTMTSSLKLSDYGKNKLSGSIIIISGEYKIPTTLQYGNTNPYIGIELALIRDSNTGGSSQWMSWFGGTTIGSAATDGWVKYTQALRPSNYDFSQYNLHLILRDFIGSISFRNLKIEFGDKPTDWTPAPEDIENDILESSKTATNYLNFSSSGLVIGDLTSSTLGKNVLIDSDSVDIRNGTTTLASFGADYLYLAKNSRNAKIDLCNGLATMYHESKYSYDTIFIIDTGNTTEIMGLINPLCITSVDDLDQVSIQFANANGVMGGVGIVGSWLRRFGSNMFDTYTILDSGNYDEVMDSGWFYGGAIGDGFSIYANDTQIQYRKIGKIVHIRGAVKPTTDIAGSTTSYTIFTLPEGYRPSAPVYARCQGSSANSWLLSVTAAGAVRFSRYGYGSTYVTATAGTWLPFDVTFFID